MFWNVIQERKKLKALSHSRRFIYKIVSVIVAIDLVCVCFGWKCRYSVSNHENRFYDDIFQVCSCKQMPIDILVGRKQNTL